MPRWKKPNFSWCVSSNSSGNLKGKRGNYPFLSIFWAPQFLRDSHVSLVLNSDVMLCFSMVEGYWYWSKPGAEVSGRRAKERIDAQTKFLCGFHGGDVMCCGGHSRLVVVAHERSSTLRGATYRMQNTTFTFGTRNA